VLFVNIIRAFSAYSWFGKVIYPLSSFLFTLSGTGLPAAFASRKVSMSLMFNSLSAPLESMENARADCAYLWFAALFVAPLVAAA
jgi:hypothetical protein